MRREQYERLVKRLDADGFQVEGDRLPERLKGGLANLNYRMDVDGTPVVLRVAPSGEVPPGAHDMAREHKVLSRLAAVFPLAPRSFYLCEDKEIFGAPFQLIEYRGGRSIRGEDLSSIRPDEDLRGSLHEMLADVMARFHSIDAGACGLDDLGKPDGFIPRAAAGWSRRGLLATQGTSEAVLVREISAWLNCRLSDIPEPEPALLHCDIKLDNLILAFDDLTPVAMVDWDMATRGDPLFDLATLLSYWSMPDDPECLRALGQMPTALPGFPSRQDMIDAYVSASGRSVKGLAPIEVLCLFKLGVVFLQLHARWESGALGDARYARFRQLGFELLEHTLNTIRQMRH